VDRLPAKTSAASAHAADKDSVTVDQRISDLPDRQSHHNGQSVSSYSANFKDDTPAVPSRKEFRMGTVSIFYIWKG